MSFTLGYGPNNYQSKEIRLGSSVADKIELHHRIVGKPSYRGRSSDVVTIGAKFECPSGVLRSSSKVIKTNRFRGRNISFSRWRNSLLTKLQETARDYLYVRSHNPDSFSLTWRPIVFSSWQLQLSGEIDTNVDAKLFDIDPLSSDSQPEIVQTLQSLDRDVVCYFSAGTWENWRTDAKDYPDSILGNRVKRGDGGYWRGERWLDIRQITTLRQIIRRRLEILKILGCQGVDPDNLDSYQREADPGFPITKADAILFARMVAFEAHRLGLAVGLKNALQLVEELAEYFEFAVNEQCFQYGECEPLDRFISADKPVFGVEYAVERAQFCDLANERKFSWIKKGLELDSELESCH